ncbi:phospholipase C [Mycobacterium botniense]|uniref:phospholipase C n=1 Tax=Mycobacterium botniense TaxID=84962 RepID=A0A7I9Y0A8_9MYCO|nr:phospholipase C [Mycobacterium botniense]GFG75501.1 phospholipase C 1 [Mycobacterium botniense]
MSNSPFDGMSRREFIAKVTAAGGTAMLAAWAAPIIDKAYAMPVPSGSLQSIQHIVLFMQENHSFDNYFGTRYAVNGFGHDPNNPPPVFRQRGWAPSPTGGRPTDFNNPSLYTLPFRLNTTRGPSLDGECVNDPDHTWIGMHKAWNGGANDMWLPNSIRAVGPRNAPAVMGYYTRADLPVHYMLADKFTICDNYFCSVLGPTIPNRLYWLSATIDPEGNFGGPIVETPGIWPNFKYSWEIMPQALDQAQVSWKVYNSHDVGPINRVLYNGLVSAFKQARDIRSSLWRNGIAPRYPSDFAADVAANRLPQVSWVIGPLLQCEHPALPVSLGGTGIVNVLRILLSNPQVWEKTALIVTYDENGGFFDHVTPPTAPPGTAGEYIPQSIVSNVPDSGGISGPIGLGYRVPCLVISPFSRGGRVDSTVYDHTSQLRLIETRFGVQVPNLTSWRRATTGDMTNAFDFSTFDPGRPYLDTPTLDALPKLPQCVPNVVTGFLDKGTPYRVPYPQQMPVQETGPPA